MGKVIETFPWGWIGTYDDNEIEVVSTIPDPPKVRLAVVDGKVESNLGGVSFNIRRADERHDEMGYMMGRMTSNGQTAALYVALAPARGQSCKEVFYIDPSVAIFQVPIAAPGLPPNSRTTRFYTDGGKFCINWQDDTGKPVGVIYDTMGTADETKWKHVGFVPVQLI